MQNDRQRAWLWALGVGVGVVLFVAGTWRLATFDQTWRAFVRVKIEVVPGSWTNRSFNPFLLEDQIKSASNNFVDPMFRRELESRSGTSVDEFRFVKGFQYRSTTIIELEFAGRTEAEVKMLGETAAQLWRERLITNTPPVVSDSSIPTLSPAHGSSGIGSANGVGNISDSDVKLPETNCWVGYWSRLRSGVPGCLAMAGDWFRSGLAVCCPSSHRICSAIPVRPRQAGALVSVGLEYFLQSRDPAGVGGQGRCASGVVPVFGLGADWRRDDH